MPVERAPVARKARSDVEQQGTGLREALDERGIDERSNRPERQSGRDEEQRLRGLRGDDEERGCPDVLPRHRDDFQERADRPRQDHAAEERRVGHEGIAAEDPRDQAGPQRQGNCRSATNCRVKQKDVQHHGFLALLLARQEIVGGHAEAERQHGHRRGDDEKGLFVEAELALTERPHENQRQRNGQCEARSLCHEQPERLSSQRWGR